MRSRLRVSSTELLLARDTKGWSRVTHFNLASAQAGQLQQRKARS